MVTIGVYGFDAESWFNRNWRAGVERLVREHPHIAATWLDADHQLVFTHAPDIAQIIRSATGPATS